MNDTAELFDLTGRVALVSGASGSLGSAVSKGLAASGATVVVSGRSAGPLDKLASEIDGQGGRAEVVVGDPTNEEEATRTVQETLVRGEGLDILVTAAGHNKPQPIVEQPLSEWEAIIASQLKATWLLCRAAGRVMIERGRGGKVVLIGSQRGFLGMPNYSAYSPAKAAVHLLARTLAWEWGPHHINVNCLAPGLFRSSLTEWMWGDDATYQRLLGRIPIGRLGEPHDFVGAAIFLCSRASDWMTGAVIPVDGGYTAG